jgi:hypothetical protein
MTSITLDQPAATLVAKGILRVVPWDGFEFGSINGQYVGERVTIVASDKEPELGMPDHQRWLITDYDGEGLRLTLPDPEIHGPVPLPLGQPVGSAVVEAVVPIVANVAAHDAPVPSIIVRDRELWHVRRGKHDPTARLMKRLMDHVPFFDWTPSGECEDCRGAGTMDLDGGPMRDCPTCGGTGRIERYALVLTDQEEK